jgi:hypothetical protein
MNRATSMNVATIGVLFGISGMSHGFFEALQGIPQACAAGLGRPGRGC